MFACGSICFSDDLSLNLRVVEETDLIFLNFWRWLLVCVQLFRKACTRSVLGICAMDGCELSQHAREPEDPWIAHSS